MLCSLEGSKRLTMSVAVKEPEQGDKKCEFSKPWMGARKRILPKGSSHCAGTQDAPRRQRGWAELCPAGPCKPLQPLKPVSSLSLLFSRHNSPCSSNQQTYLRAMWYHLV